MQTDNLESNIGQETSPRFSFRENLEEFRRKIEPLEAKIVRNLNLPSVADILLSGPDRWLLVGKDLWRGITGKGFLSTNEKEVIMTVAEAIRDARSAGQVVYGIEKVEKGEAQGYTVISKLPKRDRAALAYRPGADKVNYMYSPVTEEYLQAAYAREDASGPHGRLPQGRYLVIHSPTSHTVTIKRRIHQQFNNGMMVVRPDGTILDVNEIPRGQKGGVAIAYNEGISGTLQVLLPKEIDEVRSRPEVKFPKGGVVLGTSVSFETPVGFTGFTAKQVGEIMLGQGYFSTYNKSFGSLVEKGPEIYYGTCVVKVPDVSCGEIDKTPEKVIEKTKLAGIPDEFFNKIESWPIAIAIHTMSQRAATLGLNSFPAKVTFLEENHLGQLDWRHQGEKRGRQSRRGISTLVPDIIIPIGKTD